MLYHISSFYTYIHTQSWCTHKINIKYVIIILISVHTHSNSYTHLRTNSEVLTGFTSYNLLTLGQTHIHTAFLLKVLDCLSLLSCQLSTMTNKCQRFPYGVIATMIIFIIPYSLIFLRSKHFVILPNSAQKQIFTDKIFIVKLPTRHYCCYKLEVS